MKMYKAVFIISAALLCCVVAAQNVFAQTNTYVWSQLSSSVVNPGTTDLRGIWGTVDNGSGALPHIFVVGAAGKVYHRDSLGCWVEETVPEGRDLNGVYGWGPQSVIAVANTKRTMYYYNGSWAKRSSDNLDDALYSVWGPSPTNAFAAGKLRDWLFDQYNFQYININNSANIGTSTPSAGVAANRYGVWGTSATNVFLVGNQATNGSKTNIQYYNGSWSQISSGYNSTTLYGIWGCVDNGSTNIYTAGASGTILKSTNNGGSWMKMTTPTTATLRSIHGTGASNIIAVGDGGVILHYNGTAWETLSSGTTVNLKGVWSSLSGDLYAVGSNGTILHGTKVMYTTWYRDADGDGYGNAADTKLAITQPSGYVADNTDCNDSNASVHPNAPEVCNGIDDDCDGRIDEGFGVGSGCSAGIGACYREGVKVCSGGIAVCNAVAGTPAAEVCNGIDDDCDGQTDEGVMTTFYRDGDGDGYGNAALTVQACSAPAEHVVNGADCNDNNTAINPGAAEVCNGIDDNCNGQADEGFNVGATCSAGVGACYSTGVTVCSGGAALCNAVAGTPTAETCNGKDDDCDGQIDNGLAFITYYRDADGDGFGNPGISQQACAQPEGYVINGADCNDNNTAINPAAAEVCNGIDDNCNGQADEGFNVGAACSAGIGACYSEGVNVCSGGVAVCNAVPGTPSPETCNGKDDDCDGEVDNGLTITSYYRDADGDGFGNPAISEQACIQPAGFVPNGADCNDNNTAINPAAAEVCDGIDNNCDGQIDEGFNVGAACSVGVGACYSAGVNVCSGGVAICNAVPGTPTEETCNGIDDDCDGQIDNGLTFTTYYRDADGDGFGNPAISEQACAQPEGYVINSADCNDNNTAVNPAAAEVCNGIDDNCNGQADEGFNVGAACSAGVGACYSAGVNVCSGGTAVCNAVPGTPTAETCNGIDDNCDGEIDEGVTTTFYRDADGDGFGNAAITQQACDLPEGYATNGADCNDNNTAINPAVAEVCNGIDDNCNGQSDEGFNVGAICSAGIGACYSTGVNVCSGGVAVCNAVPGTPTAETCNGIDDNCNGETDEGFNVGAACSAGVGACNRAGVNVCSGGAAVCDAVPGTPTAETCNGIDDNCDGQTDEGVTITFYLDADGDSFGTPAVSVQACTRPDGYRRNNIDCDDGNAAVNPYATEVCDGIDNNCNGSIDEGFNVGAACSAGVGACNRPGVNVCSGGAAVCNAVPGTPAEETCNGIDDNCDGQTDEGLTTTFYRDADGDGFGTPAVSVQACSRPEGYRRNNIDCDDSNAAVNPYATEVCDSIDNNCDGQIDEAGICGTDEDTDHDGVLDAADNCPNNYNPQQLDADGDGSGDVCDTTPGCGGCGQAVCESYKDTDKDGIPDVVDTCPNACNSQQLDADNDGIGDVCDTDPGCGGSGQSVCETVCTP